MHFTDGQIAYSPSDLITFVESEYASWMDRLHLEGAGGASPDEADDQGRMIMEAGLTHERCTLELLAAEGPITHIASGPGRHAATLRAMALGTPVIYQAYLECDGFTGIADFLIRAEGTSTLGDYHYEVWDAKLGQSMKPHYAIQLCCYADMLAPIQGRLPANVGIFLATGERHRLRTPDFVYYYRVVREKFLEFQDGIRPSELPDPADYREHGRWSGHAGRLLEAADAVARVANIRSTQIKRLHAAGIRTMTRLSESGDVGVPRLALSTHYRLCEQAGLQLVSARNPAPQYHVLPHDREGIGLCLLPPASPADICFDIEGYPLIPGGLEYLLGATHLEAGSLHFKDWWAHDPDQEERCFREFIQWVYGRRRQDPAMHVYHYAPYETAALKRLAARYGCCEAEVDDLLRSRVFVDLYTVVRQGLLVGEPAYSLKNIEHLYMPKRTGEVATAGDSMVYYHAWRAHRDGNDWTQSLTLRRIRDYNQADCDSTWKLTEWLREVQRGAGIAYTGPREERPATGTSPRMLLAASMLEEIPADCGVEAERWRVHRLLAYLLEFHRREEKPCWWALFDRCASTDAELEEDAECLGGLERTATPPSPVRKSLLYEYQFNPEQETRLRDGDKCYFSHNREIRVAIEHIDFERGLLTFPLGKGRPAPPLRLNLVPDEIVPAAVIADAIERVVQSYRATNCLPSALADFLRRRRPRLSGMATSGPIIPEGVPSLDGAIAAALRLDGSTLCIQGPPGCGKTYTAARMITALLRAGKRVGIMSNSHRAIDLLLTQSVNSAREAGVKFRAVKLGGKDKIQDRDIQQCADAGKAHRIVPTLAGGTAWLFAHPDTAGVFDYLFIDEAGQVSVANLVAAAASSKNLILLGDQMQLDQPTQGTHPGESGESILQYLLQDQPTIPADLGIFLDRTWRMRPELCEFISEAVYEGRLLPETATSARELRLDNSLQDGCLATAAGLVYLPIDHDGNQCESEEEVELIAEVMQELRRSKVIENGMERPFRDHDVLIVSPYNLQVRRLSQRFPALRVGTVDKFQGQEAAVVILSMAASSADAAPRGVGFLFSKNRLNVAISRAQILAIVVASPQLARARCNSIEQIELANLFCRVVMNEQRRFRIARRDGDRFEGVSNRYQEIASSAAE